MGENSYNIQVKVVSSSSKALLNIDGIQYEVKLGTNQIGNLEINVVLISPKKNLKKAFVKLGVSKVLAAETPSQSGGGGGGSGIYKTIECIAPKQNNLAISSTNKLTYFEKKSGEDYDKMFIVSDEITKEAYLLRAKVKYDSTDNRNETNIEKYNGSWTEICYDKKTGDNCGIKNVILTISEIQYISEGMKKLF